MKICLFLLLIPNVLMSQNWLEYNENFYSYLVEDFFNNIDIEKYLKPNNSRTIYYIDKSNSIDVHEFKPIFIKPIDEIGLKKEMYFFQMDGAYVLEILPLNVNTNSKLQCTIILYEVAFYRELNNMLAYSISESKKYIFDIKEGTLKLQE